MSDYQFFLFKMKKKKKNIFFALKKTNFFTVCHLKKLVFFQDKKKNSKFFVLFIFAYKTKKNYNPNFFFVLKKTNFFQLCHSYAAVMPTLCHFKILVKIAKFHNIFVNHNIIPHYADFFLK